MSVTVPARIGVRLALLIVVALVAALVATPVAQNRRAQNLAQPLEYMPGEILVKFLPGTPPGLVNRALTQMAGTHVRTFEGIGVHHWRAGRGVSTEEALDALARPPFRDFVEYAEPNYVRYAFQAYPDDPLRGDLWSFHNFGQTGGTKGADIHALATWESQGTGSPVVAVIDTGVDYTHPDLADNIWTCPVDSAACVGGTHGKDFVNGDDDPIDDNGHGTHVSGTIAAVANNGIGVMGVSWRAKVMALKFLDAGGYGSDANAILAINYARDNGATIVNASWGGGPKSQALSDAISSCHCLFVAAAGNSGNSKVSYPAGYALANIISVAATDNNDALATFSSYGSSWVDLAAPGVDILSTYRGGGYRTLSGTSMAAPHVTGVAALLAANGVEQTAAALKSRIEATVDTRASLQGKMVSGGRLNAARALNLEWSPPPSDTVAPGQVQGFVAVQGPPNSLTLSWTAPGDDGVSGTTYLYDMRYSISPITEANWAGATPVVGEPSPLAGGMGQTYDLSNLDASTTYCVGLKAIDESGNSSQLATVSAQTQVGPHWTIETIVDPAGPAEGFYHALAFDHFGNPAIAYSGANTLVRYAIWSGTSWLFSTADAGDAGIGLALGTSDRPAISHGWGKLRFAQGASVTGAPWQSQVLESGPKNDVTSIAFHPATGEPWIAYRGGGNAMPLKLTHRQGSSWSTEIVDSTPGGRYMSLVFDDGNPTIAYSADLDNGGTLDTLRFARKIGSSWSIQNVVSDTATDPGYGVHASLAYDNGQPTIAHNPSSGIWFVRWTGSAWVSEIVASGGRNSSLAYDPTDGLATVVYSTSDGNLWWAKRDASGQWSAEAVDRKATVVWVACLKFDSQGNPAVLYEDYTSKTLRLARRVPQ